MTTPAAPPNTAYVRFVFYLEKPQNSGQSIVNFDDAVLSSIPTPQLSVSQGALGFGETTTELTLTIRNSGEDELDWSITTGADWLTVTPANGTTTTGTDVIVVSANRTELSQELYHTTLQIGSNGGSKTVNVYLETPRPYSVPNQPSSVFLSGNTLYVQRRMPDGSLEPAKPFIVKGAAWSPASEGTLDDPFSRQKEFAKWYTLDIPILAKMNANTVYTFIDFGTDATAFSVLDELYKNGMYAIITVDWDGTNDTDRIRTIVDAYRNHPAVLMWAIGNEWNISTNLYHGKFSTIDEAAVATQSAAQLIKSLDTSHPVASIYGEIEILPDQPLSKTQEIVNSVCTDVDIWGLNIYRGDNFGSLFSEWASISNKPMFLSEFGADSYLSTVWYPVVGYEDKTSQANYLRAQWTDIVSELSYFDPAKVCLGGTVFEYNDEWWKVLAQDGGSPNVQDNGGFETSWNTTAQPDGFANEEYFGIVTIDRTFKEAYTVLQQAFETTSLATWHDWFAVDTRETPMVGDFNGDGMMDIITFTRDNPLAVGDVYVSLSEGNRFGPNALWHDWFAINHDETVIIGDFNGDGVDDIATWLGKSTRQVYVATSYGYGMDREMIWLDKIGANPSDVLKAGDVDGDGRDDLILFDRTAGVVHVARSTGDGFSSPSVWHYWFAISTYERPDVGDVDGDGMIDIITFASDSPTAKGDIYVALSTGLQFEDGLSSAKWHDWFSVDPAQIIRIGDIDGDGRADFLTFMPHPSGQVYAVYSEGSYLSDNVVWTESFCASSSDVPFTGDVNGDGRDDLIGFYQGEGKVYVLLTP
jgi:hypothetical protein